MSYDFKTVYNRRGKGFYKWNDKTLIESKSDHAYPFSVADMEFKTAPEIIEALQNFTKEGFFNYTQTDNEYKNAVTSFMIRRHNWNIDGEGIFVTPGVVCALNIAVRAFTKVGDGVIIQEPVYSPFTNSVINNGRRLVKNPLIKTENSYEINFDELETLAKDEKTKLMIFCNPHNPVGRVWTEKEVWQVAETCRDNDVFLISDDVHFDITTKPHTIATTLDESFKENTLICTSISKSFNLAGIGVANIIIENDKLREKFTKQQRTDGSGMLNCYGRAATLAAYGCCDTWLDEMNKVIDSNFSVLHNFIENELSDAILFKREGTYLAWLDMSFLKMNDNELFDFMVNDCGVVPNSGTWFGDGGSGFIRLNIAVPEKALTDGLERIAHAIKKRD